MVSCHLIGLTVAMATAGGGGVATCVREGLVVEQCSASGGTVVIGWLCCWHVL